MGRFEGISCYDDPVKLMAEEIPYASMDSDSKAKDVST